MAPVIRGHSSIEQSLHASWPEIHLFQRIPNLWAALGRERTFYRLLLIAGGATAILKGLRLPYSWPATQAQIDYRHGFLRRGFFGELCRQLHLPISHYDVYTALSFLLLAGLLALLAWAAERSGFAAAADGAFSALIAGSFLISFLVNLVGFYDIVMAILVLLVLLAPGPRTQLAAAAAAGIVGVLVHELYAIAFLPVSLIGPVCRAARSPIPRQSGGLSARRWLGVALAALVPWAIVFLIALHPEMTAAQGTALKAAVRARVDFEPYDAMLEVLTFSSRDNLHLMVGMMHAGAWWVEEFFGALAFLPTAFFFLAIALRLAAGRAGIVKAFLVLCTLAPLLLNFIGFDRYRWLALVALNGVLCCIAMAYANRREGGGMPIFSSSWKHAAILLLAINLATDVGFFMGHAKGYPFRDYWTEYREAGEAHRPLLHPPELFPKRTR